MRPCRSPCSWQYFCPYSLPGSLSAVQSQISRPLMEEVATDINPGIAWSWWVFNCDPGRLP